MKQGKLIQFDPLTKISQFYVTHHLYTEKRKMYLELDLEIVVLIMLNWLTAWNLFLWSIIK